MSADEIMTPQQVADYIGYSVRSVARWRALGLIRPVGLPRRPRYRRADVDRLLVELAGDGEAGSCAAMPT